MGAILDRLRGSNCASDKFEHSAQNMDRFESRYRPSGRRWHKGVMEIHKKGTRKERLRQTKNTTAHNRCDSQVFAHREGRISELRAIEFLCLWIRHHAGQQSK